MLISIIIPTYKPHQYIWECLDSVKRQSFSKDEFEIVIVINGCKEPYLSNIQEYTSKQLIGYNVNIIQTDTPGVSNARNIGLKEMKGEFALFLDDDDYISPSYISELYKLSKNKTLALSNIISFDDKSRETLPYYLTNVFKSGKRKTIFNYRSYFSVPVAKIISREIINGRKFDTNLKNGEDSVFMFLISDKINSIDLTSDKAIYYRRIRENSATTSSKKLIGYIKDYHLKNLAFIKIWIKTPFNRNFILFLTRLVGGLKVIISYLKK